MLCFQHTIKRGILGTVFQRLRKPAMSVQPPKLNRPDTGQSRRRLSSISDDALAALDAIQSERNVRVLIVDDHAESAETLGMALEFLGYDVSVCNTGMEGLAAVERLCPAVAILDVRLPDISGYELARKIAMEPWGRGVKLVAMTGWGTADDHHDADNAGFHARFVKPIEFAQLDSAMRNMLSR